MSDSLEEIISVLDAAQGDTSAFVYERLSNPRHRGELEQLAAAHVALMTQAIRMRVALQCIARNDYLDKKKDIRKFAADAIEYADDFTVEDVIAAHKRVTQPEEH